MIIRYDKEIDAKYVYFDAPNLTGKIAFTKKIHDWLLLDCDKEGKVLGVEILDASKHSVNVSIFKDRSYGLQRI